MHPYLSKVTEIARSITSLITKSFQTKIVSLVMLSIFVTSIVIGISTLRSTEGFLTNKLREEFVSVLNSTKNEIELWYKERALDLKELFQSPVFLKPVESYYVAKSTPEKEYQKTEIRRYFKIVREMFPLFEAIIVLDDKGDPIITTDDYRKQDLNALRAMTVGLGDRVAIPYAQFHETEKRLIQWALVPLRLSRGRHAIVCARINMLELTDLLNRQQLGQKGDLYIVDKQGKLLTMPRHGPVDPDNKERINILGEKMMDVRGQDSEHDNPVVEKYTKEIQTDVSSQRLKKMSFLGSKVYMPERGWWLVCEEEEFHVIAPVVMMKKKILVADIVICGLFMVVAWRMSRSLLRPIDALSEGARKINEGMVGVHIPAGGEDEIGQMISAFNDMAKRISVTEAELNAKNKQLNRQNLTLKSMNDKLELLSITDGLTGLYNHRHFWKLLNNELGRVEHYKGELGLVLLDIDNFKSVNDQFGHATGDLMLQNIAKILRETVRETDIVARYGGEEFAVLLPNSNQNGLMGVSEKIRKAVEDMVFKVPETDITVSATVSVGVSLFKGNRREFFNSADQALYTSKRKGKNQVNFASVN